MSKKIRIKKRINPDELDLKEKLVHIRRVSKTVAGGRRLRFSALVVVGDEQGHVGVGIGKGREIPEAIRKASQDAKKTLIKVPLKGTTIPHEIRAKYSAAEVLLKPASSGTGVRAGRAVRAVVEMAGIKDILTKSLGSSNPISVARATLKALSLLKDPEEVLKARGKL